MAESRVSCACGRTPDLEDRFCAACGSALPTHLGDRFTASQPGPSVDEAFDGDLLIGGSDATGSGSVQSESEVTSTGRLRWILFGVGALGLLVFGLAQWPQSEPPPQAAAETDADAAETDADADDSANDAESPNTTVEDTTTTAPRDTDATEVVDDTAIAASTGPLLGETTGLGIVVYSGPGPSKLFDLDSGQLHELNVGGAVLAAIGSTLVVSTESSGQIILSDLARPDDDDIPLSSPEDRYLEFTSTEDGLVWVTSSGRGEEELPTLEAYDLEGNKVDEVSIEVLGLNVFFWGGGTSLVGVEGNGIYRRDGADFRWVADGALLAHDDSLALIRTCDRTMRCEAAWYEGPNFTDPLDLPSPPVEPLDRLSIAGRGRWLIRSSWNNGSSDLIDIATGEVVRTTTSDQYFGPSVALPMSPDGRWIVEQVNSRTTVIDTRDGTEFELELPVSGGYGAPPVFVEMDKTSFG